MYFFLSIAALTVSHFDRLRFVCTRSPAHRVCKYRRTWFIVYVWYSLRSHILSLSIYISYARLKTHFILSDYIYVDGAYDKFI